ncbi:MAG: hypothetical protein BroJett039_14220 [Chloroflexota bacterium]|nr:MAG: hypothetical protein BroJett039_14220 [Chloroflexota bacterium]
MEIIISLFCLCLVFAPPLCGVGFALLLEKRFGLWAYLGGWALSVFATGGAYILYDIALRLTPCEPADKLACGEPLASAFVFLVGWLCVILIANFLAQLALYLFLRARREREGLNYAAADAFAEPQ